MNQDNPHRISVNWAMSDPPVSPDSWHPWETSLAEAETRSEAGDESLEEVLAWPRLSLAMLRLAFEQKLGRSRGWKYEGKDTQLAAGVEMAARVYKRGVGFSPGDIKPQQREDKGQYEIEVLTDNTPHPPDQLFRAHEFLVIDGNVFQAWPSLMAQSGAQIFTLDEHTKTIESVANLLAAWRHQGCPKSWCIVGGGIISDTAAFAAALVGCQIRFLPTTLLAMADACVGGKTGVNFQPFGKNQLGRFHFPSAVHVWTGWLRSLPPRELKAGGVECIKHTLLEGEPRTAQQLAQALATKNLAQLSSLLPCIIAIKAQIVAEDPTEQGKRAILNLGHTLGHALEALSQERSYGETTLLHGEAVGLGILFALHLSELTTGLAASTRLTMQQVLCDAGCIVSRSNLQQALGGLALDHRDLFFQLLEKISHDKKSHQDKLSRWVLLEGWGKPARSSDGEWVIPVSNDSLKDAWVAFLQSLT